VKTTKKTKAVKRPARAARAACVVEGNVLRMQTQNGLQVLVTQSPGKSGAAWYVRKGDKVIEAGAGNDEQHAWNLGERAAHLATQAAA